MPRKPEVVEKCCVVGCKAEGEKSVARNKLEDVFGSDGIDLGGRRGRLCREHYKRLKKETKQDRTFERLAW